MTVLVVVWLVLIGVALLFNHGAHRKPTPRQRRAP